MSSWKVMWTSAHCQQNQSSIAAYRGRLWVSSWRGWRENHQLFSEAVTAKEAHSNSRWRHRYFSPTSVLLLGLQACCTSFHKEIWCNSNWHWSYGREARRQVLLAVHALSGCDTVSYPFRKRKISALHLLLKLDLNLQVFTEPDSEEVDWMKAGIEFLSYLYCGKIMESLNNLRFTLFSKKKDPQWSRPYLILTSQQ